MQLTEEISAKIMRGVFSALDYLHNEKNVIHRDVKPENIVIMDHEHYTVKLIDFGLAVKATKQGIKDFAHCGTLLYTPPEQVLNLFAYAKVSPSFSLESGHVGGRNYYLLTGLRPTSARGGHLQQSINGGVP